MEPQIATKDDVAAVLKDMLGPMGEQMNALRAEVEATKGAMLATTNVADLLKGIMGAGKEERTQTATSDSLTFSRGVQCLVLSRFDVKAAKELAMGGRYGKGAARERLERWFDSGQVTQSGFEVKALGSNDFDAGGALAPGGRSNEIIELLRPASVVRASGAVEVPLDGTLTMPMLTAGATATYVGENSAGNASQQTVGDMSLTEKQLMIFVPVSNKLLRVADVAVDNMIRQDMIATAATKEDVTFLTSDGSQNKPLGLRFLAADANVITTSYVGGGTTLTNIVTALAAAILLLKNANVRFIRPGWIFTPSQHLAIMMIRDTNGQFVFKEEMSRGTLLGYPFKVTTNMTTGNFCFADFADVVIGQATAVTIDASNTAAYQNSAGTVVAAFSADQTIVRLKTSHDLNLRHRQSVAWFTNAAWSPA